MTSIMSATDDHFVPNVRLPRVVTVAKGESFSSFGFNLTGHKDNSGLFAQNVDEGGAAYHAGLFPGDYILAVNGQGVLTDSLSTVVSRIKASPDKITLFVCDRESREFYLSHGIAIKMQNAIHMSNEPEPLSREEQKRILDNSLYTGDVLGKRKGNKRNQAKSGASWADKKAAFDGL